MLDVLFIAAGLGALVLGSDLFVGGASTLAEAWGWSQALIGLTVVAIGTSLPELATSLVSVLRGEGDLAVGNVIGSNLFNLTGVLGVASAVRPIAGGLLDPVDLIALVAVTLFAVIALRTHLRLGRVEGALLLIGYAVYVVIRLP
jgi:cation:H+ antiporter